MESEWLWLNRFFWTGLSDAVRAESERHPIPPSRPEGGPPTVCDVAGRHHHTARARPRRRVKPSSLQPVLPVLRERGSHVRTNQGLATVPDPRAELLPGARVSFFFPFPIWKETRQRTVPWSCGVNPTFPRTVLPRPRRRRPCGWNRCATWAVTSRGPRNDPMRGSPDVDGSPGRDVAPVRVQGVVDTIPCGLAPSHGIEGVFPQAQTHRGTPETRHRAHEPCPGQGHQKKNQTRESTTATALPWHQGDRAQAPHPVHLREEGSPGVPAGLSSAGGLPAGVHLTQLERFDPGCIIRTDLLPLRGELGHGLGELFRLARCKCIDHVYLVHG